ncbi:MAG: S41 family peptidase [Clostridia bacterium]|nr:S41 family peptidase [Clostridia bacterium]
MYIKKSVLVICSIVLATAIALSTAMFINPFGPLQFDDLLKFKSGVSAIKKYYYEDIDSDNIIDGALLGVSYSVEDPYTIYMDKETADSFMENIESDDYTGIGIYISSDSQDNRVTVISPLSGSPAERAGIVSGDKILEIDGEVVMGDNIDEVSNKIRGKEGTKVKIKILKKATNEQIELELVREIIKRDTVTSKMLDDKLGYIQISQFGLNTGTEFIDHFNALADQGLGSLIIDLRNNPGGYVEVAVSIADCFLDKGEIVYTLDKHGNKRDYTATKGSTSVKMAILTNSGTASASEIFVGAMKDYGLAKSVGEQTFGKGVTQIPYQFYDGSIMKITDSRYYTPNGVCIDHEGITPDVIVEMDAEQSANLSSLDLDQDTQLKTAIDLLLGE